MGGGGHFGGGMGGARIAHFGGMGGPHMGGGGWHGGHVATRNWGGGGWSGGRHVAWNGGRAWHGNNRHGNWHNHDHDHFAHDHHFHDHFRNRVFIAGIGWWPGYYGYGYDYGGCGWLYRQALYTGSPYWWNRYYACTGSYY